MKRYYPAIFKAAEEGGYTVVVPDLPGCVTEGDTLEQAMWMAQDAIGCWLDDVAEDDYPPAHGVNDINTADCHRCFVTLVEFDKYVYEQRCRAVEIARQQIEAGGGQQAPKEKQSYGKAPEREPALDAIA